jgi:hypothetical protein
MTACSFRGQRGHLVSLAFTSTFSCYLGHGAHRKTFLIFPFIPCISFVLLHEALKYFLSQLETVVHFILFLVFLSFYFNEAWKYFLSQLELAVQVLAINNWKAFDNQQLESF